MKRGQDAFQKFSFLYLGNTVLPLFETIFSDSTD